jgi:hypothetical protein
MISGDSERKWQILLHSTPNNLRQQQQQQHNSSSNNNTITCISTIWTSTSTVTASIIAYETFNIHFATSTEYQLQRVGIKVCGHFLSPVASRSVRVTG